MRLPPLALALFALIAGAAPAASARKHRQKQRRPRPVLLDRQILWRRDPATGELRAVSAGAAPRANTPAASAGPRVMRVVTQTVRVTCIVSAEDGSAVPGLRRRDFRIFDDGVEHPIVFFDASAQPASVALVIDASPSVMRDSTEMKQAAAALVGALAPLDQAAVVDFSAHTYLQLSFSDIREQILRAVERVSVTDLLSDTGGSNIYEAVYLTASRLFRGRTGRKAIVLLTDGQDSGLGLSLDPASAAPRPGQPDNRLTFDDVARLLAAQDIQVFAVSTENRPRIMTPEWLAAHQSATLISPDALRLGIPPYTLYLAELVRRAGGQLYFLNEAATVAETFRRIAEKIRAEYTLGFYPVSASSAQAASPGWHALRVALPGEPDIRVSNRAAYYVPAGP